MCFFRCAAVWHWSGTAQKSETDTYRECGTWPHPHKDRHRLLLRHTHPVSWHRGYRQQRVWPVSFLPHCYSLTLMLANLMIYKRLTVCEATEAVRGYWNILPNVGFLEQLRDLDTRRQRKTAEKRHKAHKTDIICITIFNCQMKLFIRHK